VEGCFECGNDPSGFIKCGKFIEWLRTGKRLKKASALWSYKVSTYGTLARDSVLSSVERTKGLVENVTQNL
jgi:hypothetical protein